MPSSWLTSRMSIRPSMDPEEMSWPGDRAPLDGDGWRSEQRRKGISFQVRLYACQPNVCVRRCPLRQREATTAEHKQGVLAFVSDITLPPSLGLSFSRSRFTEILIRLEFPALLSQVSLFGCLFVFSLPSFLRLPLAHLLTPSKHPELSCN